MRQVGHGCGPSVTSRRASSIRCCSRSQRGSRASGVLTHVGRTTGRTYRTPINLFRRGDECLVFLTYGSDVQWVKNVLAAGRCSVETRGRVVELIDPELIDDPQLRPAPLHIRFVERRIAGVTRYLRMRVVSST
jgi:deazaflavin-dependent oxidoreductase (nitroreductase family)